MYSGSLLTRLMCRTVPQREMVVRLQLLLLQLLQLCNPPTDLRYPHGRFDVFLVPKVKLLYERWVDIGVCCNVPAAGQHCVCDV